MSWIFGIFGSEAHPLRRERFTSLLPPHVVSDGNNDNFFIAAGGNSDTIHSISLENGSAVIVGCGMRIGNGSSEIVSTDEWRTFVTPDRVPSEKLNGHFIAVRIRNGIVDCFSDRAGLRTLYLGKLGDSWIFSTILPWVCRSLPDVSIDREVFGAGWVSLQQYSLESPVRGTQRLPPNGRWTIGPNGLSTDISPWIPDTLPERSSTDLLSLLESVLTIRGKSITLGLSGGFDSRLLLAFLQHRNPELTTYAFGESNEPDVVLAASIARSCGIPFTQYEHRIPSRDDGIRLLYDYVEQVNCIAPASESIRLNHYDRLRQPGVMMMDGGNGEILRRQFLNRLVVRHKNDVRTLNIRKIASELAVTRADIFTRETTAAMEVGAFRGLEESFTMLPPPQRIGVENFLDRWIALRRIPIGSADAQARIDGSVINLMPFSQPDVIIGALSLPLSDRRNGRMVKRVLRLTAPTLTKFPLIKNNIPYPYRLTMLQSRIWTAVRSRLTRAFTDPLPAQYFETMKEFVLDRLHSKQTSDCPLYDMENVRSIVLGYYGGKEHLLPALNWWLSFDVWRELVEIKKAGR